MEDHIGANPGTKVLIVLTEVTFLVLLRSTENHGYNSGTERNPTDESASIPFIGKSWSPSWLEKLDAVAISSSAIVSMIGRSEGIFL